MDVDEQEPVRLLVAGRVTSAAQVPLPATLPLAGLGLALLGNLRQRRQPK